MNEVFEFDVRDRTIDVEVRHNPRRRTRMGLVFEPSGRVLVDAPPGTSIDEVKALLASHARWIGYRSASAATTQATWFPRSYEEGVLLFYGGTPYPLRIDPGSDAAELRNDTLRVQTDDPRRAKAIVTDWYRGRADRDLGKILAHFTHTLPWIDEMPRWRHRFMRSQWGSCTGAGRLSLNTHLVKLPASLAEYVILHELCHIQYLNHGPRFYRLMDLYMPDWKGRRRELNRYTGVLAEPV